MVKKCILCRHHNHGPGQPRNLCKSRQRMENHRLTGYRLVLFRPLRTRP